MFDARVHAAAGLRRDEALFVMQHYEPLREVTTFQTLRQQAALRKGPLDYDASPVMRGPTPPLHSSNSRTEAEK